MWITLYNVNDTILSAIESRIADHNIWVAIMVSVVDSRIADNFIVETMVSAVDSNWCG